MLLRQCCCWRPTTIKNKWNTSSFRINCSDNIKPRLTCHRPENHVFGDELASVSTTARSQLYCNWPAGFYLEWSGELRKMWDFGIGKSVISPTPKVTNNWQDWYAPKTVAGWFLYFILWHMLQQWCRVSICNCGLLIEPWPLQPSPCRYLGSGQPHHPESLVCILSLGCSLRHHAINNILWQVLQNPDVPNIKAPTVLFRSDGKRPEGTTVVT